MSNKKTNIPPLLTLSRDHISHQISLIHKTYFSILPNRNFSLINLKFCFAYFPRRLIDWDQRGVLVSYPKLTMQLRNISMWIRERMLPINPIHPPAFSTLTLVHCNPSVGTCNLSFMHRNSIVLISKSKKIQLAKSLLFSGALM